MPTVNLSPIGGAASQFLDNNGVILSGGKIYTYAAGTTTPQATYTSVSGATPHANPIILDSAGRVPGGEIWLIDNLTYKFTVETSVGVLLGTYDNVPGINDINLNANAIEYDPPFVGALTSGYTVQDKLSQTISVKDFGAVGNGIADDTAEIQAALTAGAGRSVYFPGGTYLISATLTVPADTMVTGDGYGSVVFQNTREQNVFELNNNCTVQHLRLKGDGVSSGGVSFQKNNGIVVILKRNIKVLNCFIHAFEANGIYISGSNNTEIIGNYLWDNKYSFSSGSDIALYGGGGSQRTIISKNFCFSNNSQGIMADAIAGDTDFSIEGNICVTLNATTWAEESSANVLRRHGIIAGYAATGGIGRYLVANNICRNTLWTGIYYQGGAPLTQGVQIIGNQCSLNGLNGGGTSLSAGIYVATQGNGDLIANNLIEDYSGTVPNGTGAIKVAPSATATSAGASTIILNNVIRSSLNTGILLSLHARNVEVRGNTIINSAQEDIVWFPSAGIADVGNHSIKDNRIQRTNTAAPAIYIYYQASTLPTFVQNNYILGSDNTVNSTDNVGIKWSANPNIYITGNTISNFYYGVYKFSNAIGRDFSNQFVDRNNLIDCNIGLRIASNTNAAVIPVQDNVFTNVTTQTSGGGSFNVAYIARRAGDDIYFQSAAAPTVGTWAVGDFAQQLTPVVGQPKGWMCTVAGNPGTWVSTGNL